MLLKTAPDRRRLRSVLLVVCLVAGSLAAARPERVRPHAAAFAIARLQAAGGKVAARGAGRRIPVPHATTSLYEHSVHRTTLRRQGCRAAKHGVSGIVILDFGQPAYNGHTYGTTLFSGRFAGNRAITRAMLAYAHGYAFCLRHRSHGHIALARGTSNYQPQVPSPYKAGRKWARETRALRLLLVKHGLSGHVTSAAADDVEPAWDRTFRNTRDFFRGYRDARAGQLLYNYGSLDGGIGSIWSARQSFYVASGMRYSRALPEIYNRKMARQWASLALAARRLYHRPIRFAGVLTTHDAKHRFLKPREAHRALVSALASYMSAAPAVPPTVTNIGWSE